ncbi:MAG: hypothetical protein K5860_10615 [Bacteroidales bacterium]|nr:hypothetical protein [Bacteroidales bacterium]
MTVGLSYYGNRNEIPCLALLGCGMTVADVIPNGAKRREGSHGVERRKLKEFFYHAIIGKSSNHRKINLQITEKYAYVAVY